MQLKAVAFFYRSLLPAVGTIGVVLGAGTLLPFKAAAAGAGVVAADLDDADGLALGGTLGTGCAVAGHEALTGGLGHLLPLRGRSARTAHLDGQQHLDAGLADGIDHLVEHVKALDAVLNDGVFLAVAAQRDALTQLVHVVNMVHPLAVYTLEQADAFQLPHQLRAVALFLVVQDVHPAVVQQIGDALDREAVVIRDGIVEVGVGRQPALIVAAERTKVPLVLDVTGQELLAAGINVLPQHIVHLGADVLTVEHLAALAVDDLTLLVHDIVVLQHVLADLKVPAFQLLLGAFEGAGDHAVLDGGVLVQLEGIHQAGNAVAAEQAHQVIFQAQVEAGCAGVALTAGTAAQLVVDAAALVALGADDEQTARLAHLVRFGFDGGLVLGVQLLEPPAGREDVLIGGVAVAVGLGQQQFHGVRVGIFGLFGVEQVLAKVLFAHLGLGHELCVAAQHDIGAAACHVGGDGDGTLLTGLRHDLGLALVVLRVQHVEIAGVFLQHLRQRLALFHTDGAHQNGLAVFVALHHLLDDGAVFAVDGLVDRIGIILADVGAVGGHGHDVQAVDLGELGGLGLGRTGHTGQLLVHAEIVLEGDGRQRLALGGDLHALFGLDGLMQALVVAAADHQAARELIDDDDLAVLDHIVDVLFHDTVGLDGLVDVVGQRHVLGSGQVLDLEVFLGLFDASGGQGASLVLFVHNVIAVGLLVGLHLVFQLDHHALAQGADETVHLRVQAGRILAAAGNDERGAGFVDEDGVHLIDDGVGVAALDHVVLIGHHIVAQVVETELVVGAVGDIGIVGTAAAVAVDALHDEADRQAQPAVELAHPLAVALGQIVVDGDDVDAFAGQGVQVGGQGGHKGLAFTGLHLSDGTAMQGDAAGDLHREVLHAQHTPGGLAADGKGIGQDIVQRLAAGQTRLQCGGLGLQVGIGQCLVFGFQGQHLFGDRVDLFQLPVREGTEDLFS